MIVVVYVWYLFHVKIELTYYVFKADSLSISDILGFGSMINNSTFGSGSGVGGNSCKTMDSPLVNTSGYNSQTPNSSITSPGAFNLASPQTTFDAFQVFTLIVINTKQLENCVFFSVLISV